MRQHLATLSHSNCKGRRTLCWRCPVRTPAPGRRACARALDKDCARAPGRRAIARALYRDYEPARAGRKACSCAPECRAPAGRSASSRAPGRQAPGRRAPGRCGRSSRAPGGRAPGWRAKPHPNVVAGRQENEGCVLLSGRQFKVRCILLPLLLPLLRLLLLASACVFARAFGLANALALVFARLLLAFILALAFGRQSSGRRMARLDGCALDKGHGTTGGCKLAEEYSPAWHDLTYVHWTSEDSQLEAQMATDSPPACLPHPAQMHNLQTPPPSYLESTLFARAHTEGTTCTAMLTHLVHSSCVFCAQCLLIMHMPSHIHLHTGHAMFTRYVMRVLT